jgi:methionine synthase I (cobalamin-dependent)
MSKIEHQNDILALLGKRVVILDGAMGTMLMAEGLQGGDAPERWNLEKPDIVQSIHRRYFEVGSDAVLTNTFGGNRLKLERKGLKHEVVRLNTLAAELAKTERPPGKFVAGDIGPSGELAVPLGRLTPQYLEEIFAEQAQALVAGGADFIIIETMFSLEEALAALRGARRVDGGPAFVTMTYEKKDKGFFTLMGETPEVCTKRLEHEGADGIGANCTLGSTEMIPLVGILRESTSLPVIVQPNAGKPIIKDGKTMYDQTPDAFASDIQVMVDAGANVVGGCCGTTPQFISAIHRSLFGQ